MELRFDGKCVVITGGSEGIGYETARLFLENGAKVCICGRREEKLKEAAEKLAEAAEGRLFTDVCDVSDSASFRVFLRKATSDLGGLDILVNNAGIIEKAGLMEMSEELWDRSININLKSVFIGVQEGASLMKNGGVIINAASFAAVLPSVGYSAYAVSKAGVQMLTRAAASELAPLGIRVLGYIPGVIDTRLNAETIAKHGTQARAAISQQRFGRPEEVASVIFFMASDAAGYMTGTCVEMSGGKFSTQNPSAAWAN